MCGGSSGVTFTEEEMNSGEQQKLEPQKLILSTGLALVKFDSTLNSMWSWLFAQFNPKQINGTAEDGNWPT